jgi:hypothetical protein
MSFKLNFFGTPMFCALSFSIIYFLRSNFPNVFQISSFGGVSISQLGGLKVIFYRGEYGV